jgi:hypothetical protein
MEPVERDANPMQVVTAFSPIGLRSEPVDPTDAESGDYQNDRDNNHNVGAPHFNVIIAREVPLLNSAYGTLFLRVMVFRHALRRVALDCPDPRGGARLNN